MIFVFFLFFVSVNDARLFFISVSF